MRNIIYLTCVLGLSGCTLNSTNPNYLELADTQRQRAGQWQTQQNAIAEQVEHNLALTQLIDSPELAQLVSLALANNPDLQQTLIAVQISESQWQQAHGNRLPEANLDFNGTKEENSQANYNTSLSISWQLDLWQQLGDLSRAAEQDVEQQQRLYQAAQDTLTSNVMIGWLDLISQQATINIQAKRVKSLASYESFIVQRYRNGLGTLEDLASARTSLASAQATQEAYQENFLQQQRALKALLGDHNTILPTLPSALPSVLTPLAELPEQTLARRPDLQAAYAAVAASDLRSAAAYKDMLPKISLQAALNDSATSPRDALLTNPLWSLLGNLTAPLYQGGKLRAAAQEAELETARAYQNYRSTLLTAVTEVEDALGLEQSLSRQQSHLETALSNAKNTLEQYRKSYRSGLVDMLDLLIVERETFDLAIELNQINANRLTNRITLGLALGLASEAETQVGEKQ